jgi:16S rRNA (cytidine1402-2'-O)-methyltransferase
MLDTLQLLAEILPTRELVVARELTKIHEEILRGTASELHTRLSEADRVRGEFVLIIAGAESPEVVDQDIARRLLGELTLEEVPKKTIVRILTNALGISRNEAYRLVHRDEATADTSS